MGLFGLYSRGKKPYGVQGSTITHRAVWNFTGSWATFFITSEGVSWNQSQSELYALDDMFVKAALAQLEQAYHLSISFPEAETRIMDLVRIRRQGAMELNPDIPDIPDDARPYFEWSPPLPGYE